MDHKYRISFVMIGGKDISVDTMLPCDNVQDAVHHMAKADFQSFSEDDNQIAVVNMHNVLAFSIKKL